MNCFLGGDSGRWDGRRCAGKKIFLLYQEPLFLLTACSMHWKAYKEGPTLYIEITEEEYLAAEIING